MPHSLRLHNALANEGYVVYFWYYKNLTTLYPWKKLDVKNNFRIYGENGNTLFKLLKEILKSDFVIITGWHTYIHVFLAFICYTCRIKYAYWLDVPENTGKGISVTFKKILLKMADYLLVTGNEGVNRISQIYKIKRSKFRDFPYLSAEITGHQSMEYNKFRMNEMAKGHKINVLITNRFEKRKGYLCLYNALKKLEQDTIDRFKFTIIGSGSEFENYKRLFTELKLDVEFLFWVEYSEYLEKIMETDVLIHASIHEPFGIPPIDAMAFGKLVIASAGVISAMDRISDGKNGFRFEVNDSERLSELLNYISKYPNVIYRLGSAASILAERYQVMYNIEVINGLIQ